MISFYFPIMQCQWPMPSTGWRLFALVGLALASAQCDWCACWGQKTMEANVRGGGGQMSGGQMSGGANVWGGGGANVRGGQMSEGQMSGGQMTRTRIKHRHVNKIPMNTHTHFLVLKVDRLRCASF